MRWVLKVIEKALGRQDMADKGHKQKLGDMESCVVLKEQWVAWCDWSTGIQERVAEVGPMDVYIMC